MMRPVSLTAVRRSASASFVCPLTAAAAGAAASGRCLDETRLFSSQGGGGGGGGGRGGPGGGRGGPSGRGGRGGGRGGGGRGAGGRGGAFPTGRPTGRGGGDSGAPGRGAMGALARFRERRALEKNKQRHVLEKHHKKANFYKTVLEPAARGELQKGHQSGIPKLTGRKIKGHALHDSLDEREVQRLKDVVKAEQEEEEGYDAENEQELANILKGSTPTTVKLSQVVQQEEEYDSEAEYDELEAPMSLAEFERHEYVTKNEDGTYTIEYDSDWGEDSDEEERPPPRGARPPRREYFMGEDVNPEAAFFYKNVMDFSDPFPDAPPEVANRLLPLRDHGPDLDGFLEAMAEHPSKYAEVKRVNHHPESLREAQPEFDDSKIRQPPLEFVESHKRFLYVTGLSPKIDKDDEPDFDNPLHRHEVQKLVSQLFRIKSEHVCPANMTSAFIGYTTIEGREEALKRGPAPTAVTPIVISKVDEDTTLTHKDFIQEQPERVVQLSNLPKQSAEHWCRRLFPEHTEVGSIYGPLDKDRILQTSPTSALIQFDSREQAESALESSLLSQYLRTLAQTPSVRYFKARRELVSAGYSGPARAHLAYKKGPRLVVDGQVPSKSFYISHFEVLELTGLDDKDESITEQEISQLFQPYCEEPRDVIGSVEFARCARGLRTDRAFVGFDQMGQGQAALEALGDVVQIGNSTVQLRLCHDKPQRRGAKREVRPQRSTEELLDSLTNWEQYVDPNDLEYILQNGVRKEVLDDAFLAMRYKNKTFGPTDQAMEREKLDPELAQGELFKRAVQTYIDLLKQCIPTREKPGLLYEGMFLPDEDVDLSIFDREQERQKKLQQERSKVL